MLAQLWNLLPVTIYPPPLGIWGHYKNLRLDLANSWSSQGHSQGHVPSPMEIKGQSKQLKGLKKALNQSINQRDPNKPEIVLFH